MNEKSYTKHIKLTTTSNHYRHDENAKDVKFII